MTSSQSLMDWCGCCPEAVEAAITGSDLDALAQLITTFDQKLAASADGLTASDLEILTVTQGVLEEAVAALRSDVMSELRALQRGRAGNKAYARTSQLAQS